MLKLFLLLPGLLLLSGCLGGSSLPVHYYLLDPVPTSVIKDTENRLHIEIAAVELPQYLDRPQIVSRTGNHQLKLSELHQWGGNLRKNMLRTLAINISQRLNTPNVAVAPHPSSVMSAYRVEVEILRFEHDSDLNVHLGAQWRISTGLERKSILTRITNIKSKQTITAADYDGIIADMSSLYAELSDEIASAILSLENP